jgi:hypothetical protein
MQLDVLLVTAALAIAGGAAVLSQSKEDSGYLTIAEDLEPLRAAFNADLGNVRAILIASPT